MTKPISGLILITCLFIAGIEQAEAGFMEKIEFEQQLIWECE